jgi:hypothetical protein
MTMAEDSVDGRERCVAQHTTSDRRRAAAGAREINAMNTAVRQRQIGDEAPGHGWTTSSSTQGRSVAARESREAACKGGCERWVTYLTRYPYADAVTCQTARPRPPLHTRPSPPGAAGLTNLAGVAEACHGNRREPQEETTPRGLFTLELPPIRPLRPCALWSRRGESITRLLLLGAPEVHRSKRPLLPCSGP